MQRKQCYPNKDGHVYKCSVHYDYYERPSFTNALVWGQRRPSELRAAGGGLSERRPGGALQSGTADPLHHLPDITPGALLADHWRLLCVPTRQLTGGGGGSCASCHLPPHPGPIS